VPFTLSPATSCVKATSPGSSVSSVSLQLQYSLWVKATSFIEQRHHNCEADCRARCEHLWLAYTRVIANTLLRRMRVIGSAGALTAAASPGKAHPSGCARCGAGAGCSAIKYQSLLRGKQMRARLHPAGTRQHSRWHARIMRLTATTFHPRQQPVPARVSSQMPCPRPASPAT